MSRLERVLTQALRDAGDSFPPGDLGEAQRTFLARRRRRRLGRAAGALALAGSAAAAALVVPGLIAPQEEVSPAARADFAVTGTMPVGVEPTGLDVGDGSLWVAHSGDGTLMRIDPATGDREEARFRPGEEVSLDDVSVHDGTAWAVDGRRVYLWAATSGLRRVVRETAVPSGHLDIDAGSDGLWVAHPPAGDHSVTLVLPNGDAVPRRLPHGPFSDVAAEDGRLWLLNGDSGELYSLETAGPGTLEGPIFVGPSYDDDLAAGGGYVWVANGDRGTIVRIDPATGDVSAPISVGGDYTALAIGEGYVWALAGSRDGTATVTAIDPDSAEPAGEPVALRGEPVDIAAGAGAVWVTNSATNAVTRIGLAGATPPLPSAAPTASESQGAGVPSAPPGSGTPAFVTSFDGDLYAVYDDGSVTSLVESPATEARPVFESDDTIVFARSHRRGEPVPRIVRMDLETLEETVVAEGEWPAAEPAFPGYLAWGISGSLERQGQITLERRLYDGSKEIVAASAAHVPMAVRHLDYEPTLQRIYWQAGYEGWGVWHADLGPRHEDPVPAPVAPADVDNGAIYAAPSSSEEATVHVIKLCCRMTEGDAFETGEFGVQVVQRGNATGWQKIAALPGGIDLDPGELFVVPAGTVEESETGGWERGSTGSWFLGDGTGRVWMIFEDGRVEETSLEVDAGMAVAPRLSE